MDTANPREKACAETAGSPAASASEQAPADLRRRRLLQGLAAAPAVYTLGSGAQTAVISSHQCVGQDQLPDPTQNLLQNGTGVLHVPADAPGGMCAYNYQRGAPTYTGFKVVDSNVTYYLLSYDNSTQFYDQNGASWTRQLNGKFKKGNTGRGVAGTQTNVLPAVYVNNQGGIAFYPDRSALSPAGQPISCSCWSSFAPADGNPFA
jgi:hypothetical protein